MGCARRSFIEVASLPPYAWLLHHLVAAAEPSVNARGAFEATAVVPLTRRHVRLGVRLAAGWTLAADSRSRLAVLDPEFVSGSLSRRLWCR